MSDKRIAIAAGLLAGLLVGFLLPSRWIFLPERGPGRAHGAGEQSFACPMFCVVVHEMPEDRRCPVCGMELSPIAGQSALNVAERRMAGVQAGRLRRLELERSLRAVGEVDFDETRLARITTRVGGWLEKVWADTTWMAVEKGQPLASIYSPELYAAQKDYLVATGSLRDSARRKLGLFGISDEEIEKLDRTREVAEALVLRAPRDGFVAERHALEGAAVKQGETLYAIADLSRVWVQTEIFERELASVREGQEVRLEVEGRAESLSGKVAFIDPAIDRHTRTARVRIEVDNERGLLRIGQRVDAWIEAPVAGTPLALPRSAVLSTGERSVVYVLYTESDGKRDYALDPKRLPDTVLYEMVTVKVGPLATRGEEEFYPLLEGPLEEGMVIVTKGNLLLDSQAQLSGKPSLLFPQGSRDTGGDPHAGH